MLCNRKYVIICEKEPIQTKHFSYPFDTMYGESAKALGPAEIVVEIITWV